MKAFLFIFISLAIAWYSVSYYQSHQVVIDSYESCIEARGSIIQESPATCVAHDGSRFIQPIPIPSADTSMWNTYTNGAYGYTFQYPPDWSVVEEYIYETSSSYTKNGLVLSVYVKDHNNFTQMYIDSELPLSTGLVSQEGTINIDGKAVKYQKYGDQTTHYSDFGIDLLPNFAIDTYYSNDNISQILSTFRFTNQ